MSSSTSFGALLLHGRLHSPSLPSKAQLFLALPNNPTRFRTSASVRVDAYPPRWPLRAADGERDNRVQELRVPDSWLTPAGAAQESEWLRETLHKWLDDEYCPEPANVDISSTAAGSYHESLIAGQSDLGEILLKMVGDLDKLSYRESFHGPFSAANAAVRLISQRMESLSLPDE
ncbi:hypothetical protein BDA96_08G129600 [Sorghum bicolor]|uniref:Uncharacterized protein n=2 Tax=Sorghum bicolor TaxID=4558 RepID=A0A921QHN3_SORBI|nr:uncharacterized protein LOC8067237 [Sorghum bicolor]EES17129.1 hypothetical protein SORBI_3008G116300 [Sorghum bicolor]KAG0521075.1 hypothetical protein BDA96_08G129600 [Sorghum bicolor]|eukprot:XP_002443291.1 uncharacterized protein LOC8067237 [Sorghum bicolor]